MIFGKWLVADCPACGSLHPIYFDEYAGIDGDEVYVCPVAGKIELSSATGEVVSCREVVAVEAEEAS